LTIFHTTANLLDSNADQRDQFQILGTCNTSIPSLGNAMVEAMVSGTKSMAEVQADWLAAAKLCTLSQAVATELRAHGQAVEADRWVKESAFKSHEECKALARATLKGPGIKAAEAWCAEKARTKEGWYRTSPGVEVRAIDSS
jgi:isocitrate lyase